MSRFEIKYTVNVDGVDDVSAVLDAATNGAIDLKATLENELDADVEIPEEEIHVGDGDAGTFDWRSSGRY